jgi:glutamyl-Q tRNA(Asp) synthetase
MSAILRFAPSPNGRLHLGHAYSALLNDAVARSLGGTWLLRIEDIDPVRATPDNVAGIFTDLAWLGLAPAGPVRRQSGHMAFYRQGAEQLRAAGLIYPCCCSRGEIAAAVAGQSSGTAVPRDPDGLPLYPGTCRHRADAADRIAAGAPHTWRLDMAAACARTGPLAWRAFDEDGRETAVAARPERWGDVVVVRRDVPASYHLCVVLDDAVQAITHVVRGRDLEAATDIHAVLAACLGITLPLYRHHRLLTDATGQKLAKSRNSLSLAVMRETGADPATIRRQLGFPAG